MALIKAQVKQRNEARKKKIELALKLINDYQRFGQSSTGVDNLVKNIFTKDNNDPSLKNYKMNYDSKERLEGRAKEILGFIAQSRLAPEAKAAFRDCIVNIISPEIEKLQSTGTSLPVPKVAPPTPSISTLKPKEPETISPPTIKPEPTDTRDDWLSIKKSAKKSSNSNDEYQSAKDWLAAQGLDKDEFAEQLNESSTLFTTMASKTGLPKAQLRQFWELAVQKNSSSNQPKDTLFWSNVMKEFQSLIDKVDIEEARNIMTTREQYKSHASDFLNHIAEDNYTEAQKAFENMVSSRLNDNINARAEKYCQEVLSKEAKKISRDV